MNTPFQLLVVDDDPLFQTLLREMLSQRYRVDTVNCWEACRERLEKGSPDLILLDINMAGKNGYEVCQILRSDERWCEIPVIFISARQSDEEMVRGYEVGGNDYITKPIKEGVLFSRVEAVLKVAADKKQLAATLSESQETFYRAIQEAADLGLLIRFLQWCHKADSIPSLGNLVVEEALELGILSGFQFGMGNDGVYVDYSGDEKCLEPAIIKQYAHRSKIIEHDKWTILYEGSSALLVENMPEKSSPNYGRYKDILTILLTSAAARAETIREIDSLRQSFQQGRAGL